MHRRSVLILPLLALARPTLAAEPTLPAILSITPANGLTNIDPDIRLLSIMFDRQMRNSWSFVKSDQGEWPEIKMPVFQHGDVLFADISLKPGRTYAFSLNSTRFRNFRSGEGVPLAPTLIRFTTTPSESQQTDL